jgi:hypothetical protein
MSAVKNLRAMFEQKGDTSPPERGRSPGIPHGKALCLPVLTFPLSQPMRAMGSFLGHTYR